MNGETSVQRLERYILKPDAFQGNDIPKSLDRAEVARFVVERINAETKIKPLLRVEQVVTFYDLQEVCGHLYGLLPRIGLAEVPRPAVIARTVAAACRPSEVRQVAGVAKALIANAHSVSDIQELMELQDRLGPQSDPAALSSRIDWLRSSGGSVAKSAHQNKIQTAKLDEMRNLRLTRVREANAIKARTLALTDRKNRILQEVKMYLTLDYGYLEYLTPWAASRLRRETWGLQPGDQDSRNEQPALREEVASVFATTAANIQRLPGVDPASYDSLRVRSLRAAEYFGQPLSAAEREFISLKAGRQADLLSND